MANSMNDYEKAFESWLQDNGVRFMAMDQNKRRIFARDKVKTFDFLLYPANPAPSTGLKKVVIAEIKGRKFKGRSLAGLAGMQSWVTMDDVRGLADWEQVLAESKPLGDVTIEASFIFAYKFDNIDVESDGTETYDFEDDQYIFYAVTLADYKKFMTLRSPKWETVTLPAAKFRQVAIDVRKFLSV